MRKAGFVLAGGRSSRMGQDKALLPWGESTVLDCVARAVRAAAGSVVLIAPPGRYPQFRGRVLPDSRPGQGPLAAIEAALGFTQAEWNLVVACDMPRLTAALLGQLLHAACAAGRDADCLVPSTQSRLHPLAAVYHQRCLPEFSRALDEGHRRLLDAVARVRAVSWPVPPEDEPLFTNVNTAEEWLALLQLEGKGPR